MHDGEGFATDHGREPGVVYVVYFLGLQGQASSAQGIGWYSHGRAFDDLEALAVEL